MHLDVEVSRDEYEDMIHGLLDTTLDSVSQALEDAHLLPSDLDGILLVGGSTRTPMVSRLLEHKCGIEPRQEIHPDLCVALGAGVLASRLAGHDVDRVLVDVSPFSFGPSYIGFQAGGMYPHCYHPIIRRNTPLPVTRTDSYGTTHPGQTCVEMKIYQGDDEDALKNIHVGKVEMEGLRKSNHLIEVLCTMKLDLDGILHVTAIEKDTGKSARVSIVDAIQERTSDQIATSRRDLETLFGGRRSDRTGHTAAGVEASSQDSDDGDATAETEIEVVGSAPPVDRSSVIEGAETELRAQVLELVAHSRALLPRMHAEDLEETTELIERIEIALVARDEDALQEAATSLRELIFFVEGR